VTVYERPDADGPPAGHTLFVPSLLISLAFVAWLGFQTYQLVAEREQLKALHAAQDTTVETATKVRSSLDQLASRTAKLDIEGNPNAHVIVEDLKKRGVTINPDAASKTN
jgi:hypothetical protein